MNPYSGRYNLSPCVRIIAVCCDKSAHTVRIRLGHSTPAHALAIAAGVVEHSCPGPQHQLSFRRFRQRTNLVHLGCKQSGGIASKRTTDTLPTRKTAARRKDSPV